MIPTPTLTPDSAPLLLHDIPHDVYHADPWGPSLSRSIAFRLVTKSPLHAWSAHPRLGGMLQRGDDDATSARDNGSLMHNLLFGGGQEIVTVEAKDWRTKAAQEQRDAALARGAMPVLARVYAEACAVASIYHAQLLDLGVNPLACGREAVALWHEGSVLCRARFDLVNADEGVVYDAKFLRNGRPRDFGRAMVYDGYDIQAAAYVSALSAIRPELAGRCRMEFLLCETSPPYAVARATPAGSMRTLGEQRWRRALSTWARCLEENEWPGYGEAEIEAPAWSLTEDFEAAVSSTPEPAWVAGA